MKKIYKTTIVFIFTVMISSLSAQNFNEFSNSLEKGDAHEISAHMGDKVEVSIMNDDSYTKTEAEDLLASFFTGSSSNEYKAIHKGSTMQEAYYQIGELKSNNKTYRTYMYSKKIDGFFRIQEFRIEE